MCSCCTIIACNRGQSTTYTKWYEKRPRGRKNDFFRIFFSLAHLHVESKLFCFYQNFISSAVQRKHGGARKSVTSTTTNEQTNERTNDQRRRRRRTTWTIIIARQDFYRIFGLIIKLIKNQRCASKSPRCSTALTLRGILFNVKKISGTQRYIGDALSQSIALDF